MGALSRANASSATLAQYGCLAKEGDVFPGRHFARPAEKPDVEEEQDRVVVAVKHGKKKAPSRRLR